MHSSTSAAAFTMIDAVFFVIIALSAFFGLFHGFTRIVVKTAAWIIAAWAAFEFGGFLALKLSDHGAPTPTQTFGGYALMFVVTWIAIHLIGAMLRTGVDAADLTAMDRFLGIILGAVRGACVCSLLALVMSFTSLTSEPEWHQSRSLTYIMPLTQWMRTQLLNWHLLPVARSASPKTATAELGHVYGQMLRNEWGRAVQKIRHSATNAVPTADDQPADDGAAKRSDQPKREQ